MNEKAKQRWLEMRKMGRLAYVFRYGVLEFGVFTAIGHVLFTTYRDGTATLPFSLMLSLIIFPVTGFFLGQAMWAMQECKLKRAVHA